MQENWLKKYVGEFIGTYVLIWFGVGAVFVAVYTGAYGNLHAIMWMWGIAVALAVYIGAVISGAHYNPSVTLTLAVFGRFPWKQVIPYIVSQIAGAFAAAATIWGIYGNYAAKFEAANQIVRGHPGSQLSAMVFVPYVPNPAIVGTGAEAWATVPLYAGVLSEFFGTALLVLIILTLLERRNALAPPAAGFPALLALGVFAIVGITAAPSMASLNAARDLGPRLMAYLAGWGSIAFPGPRGEWWITTIIPIFGGICGGWAFFKVLLPCYPRQEPQEALAAGADD